jgi:hypothetical protein
MGSLGVVPLVILVALSTVEAETNIYLRYGARQKSR